jgi:hypothetical protein
MKRLLGMFVVIMLMLFSCANDPAIKLAKPKTIQPYDVSATHWVTFTSDPTQAEIWVIDAKNGKEVQSLGKTPIRIWLVTNKVIVTGTDAKLKEINTCNIMGITYGSKQMEGIEFEFKIRSPAYADELKIVRIPLNVPNGTDQGVFIKLSK